MLADAAVLPDLPRSEPLSRFSPNAAQRRFDSICGANERQLLKEIDAALQRIADHTYGICEATHKPIGKQRLRAKPWARYCIESAREKELGRAP